MYGEIKQEKPRWAGIDGINGILEDISQQIDELKGQTKTDAEREMSNISGKKTDFINDFKEIDKKFYSNYEANTVNSYFSRNYQYTFSSVKDGKTVTETNN